MKYKTQIIWHLILIIILILLIVRVYYFTPEYDCDKCTIEFKHNRVDFTEDKVEYELNETAINLYNSFIEDECIVFWDRVNGFIKNG